MEIAEPVGVVAGLVPVTNPTATTLFYALACVPRAQRDRELRRIRARSAASAGPCGVLEDARARRGRAAEPDHGDVRGDASTARRS